MLRHPQLYDQHIAMGIQLTARSTLTPRDREDRRISFDIAPGPDSIFMSGGFARFEEPA